MRNNFERAFVLTLKYEGGYVDHPKDPGGATNLGVTIGTLSNYIGRQATKDEVRALTPAKVKPIYKSRCWDLVKGDNLPTGVDLVVYDFAVNSGPARAAKTLQTILGVPADGIIGADTIAACFKYQSAAIIRRYCSERMKFLRSLRTFSTFGKGWTARVNHAEDVGLAWDANLETPEYNEMSFMTGFQKARPSDQKVSSTAAARASALTTFGVIGTTAADSAAQMAGVGEGPLQFTFLTLTFIGIAANMWVAINKAKSPD